MLSSWISKKDAKTPRFPVGLETVEKKNQKEKKNQAQGGLAQAGRLAGWLAHTLF